MSNAGRGIASPTDNGPTVNAITWAYIEEAGGDALAALRLAVADALDTFAAMDRRARHIELMVSRGFTRGALNGGARPER
jgi:hypothetical protein